MSNVSTSADKTIWKAPEHVAVAVVISQEQYDEMQSWQKTAADENERAGELEITVERLRRRIERMEAVVEAARILDQGFHRSRPFHQVTCAYLSHIVVGGNAYEVMNSEAARAVLASAPACDCGVNDLRIVLAALDAQVTDTTHADNLRDCPNAVSWCEGPDRYAEICVGCLTTWTEEAKAASSIVAEMVKQPTGLDELVRKGEFQHKAKQEEK